MGSTIAGSARMLVLSVLASRPDVMAPATTKAATDIDAVRDIFFKAFI